ncbi:hypothetical protein Tco_0237772 [Tanacetum coccineum]
MSAHFDFDNHWAFRPCLPLGGGKEKGHCRLGEKLWALLVSSKLSDLLRTEADHLFLVDSRVVSISVSYESGMLLSSVGFKSILSCDIGLLDYIRTADPRKVQAVESERSKAHRLSRLLALVSVLAADKSLLSAEVSVLKSAVSQKDTNISLLDSRASYLKSALDDSQAACGEARSLISSLSSERDGLASEANEDGCWTTGWNIAMVKGLKSSSTKHGIAGTPLFAVVAYNPETAENYYLDAVRALEEADFPLVHLLKSKKDSGMDEVLDCFLLDEPLASLPEAAHLQSCLEQLTIPIYHADVNAVAGETLVLASFVTFVTRDEGARKRIAAALRQLMVDIVSHPLSSQNLLGEASTSVVISCVEDLDTDEDLGSVVCMPQLEDPRFEILP